uniref:DUF819 domain-containing protein n=1 Tax=Pyramimonas obovata TaxID=1411642 RepID=A0A7S0QRH0_9CHLO|mmetsp:Transcript_11214/g.23390  ORF Transcript_11214/g.23390 Transcript_11214/m.23390 type:complete len:504 (+) Transcript_11214:161-1672(+)
MKSSPLARVPRINAIHARVPGRRIPQSVPATQSDSRNRHTIHHALLPSQVGVRQELFRSHDRASRVDPLSARTKPHARGHTVVCHAASLGSCVGEVASVSTASGISLPLVAATDTWGIWFVLLCAASFGKWAERTPVGKALSGPVCAMLFTAVLANLGVIPPAGPNVNGIQGMLVRVATPMLLYSANMRRIFSETGRMMTIFLIAVVATVAGGLLGFQVVSGTIHTMGALAGLQGAGVGEQGWKLAAALVAKNIGGGMSYVAVASTLSVAPALIAVGLTIDYLFKLMYFPLLSALGDRHVERESSGAEAPAPAASISETKDAPPASPAPMSSEDPVKDTAYALMLSVGIMVLSMKISLPNSIPIATAITVAVATAFPEKVERLRGAGGTLGTLFLYLFAGTAGMGSGSLATALKFTPVYVFLAILYAVHLGLLLAARRVFKLDLSEVLVASNACIGAPPTAAALAVGKGWKHLVVPGFLVGVFGNAFGTFVGLWAGTSVFAKM